MGKRVGILQKLTAFLFKPGGKNAYPAKGKRSGKKTGLRGRQPGDKELAFQGINGLDDSADLSQREAAYRFLPLQPRLEDNLQLFRQLTGGSYDFNILEFASGPEKVPAALLYIDGLVDYKALEELLRTVKIDILLTGLEDVQKKDILETVRQRLLDTSDVQLVEYVLGLYHGVSIGRTALLFDGNAQALICETQGWNVREVGEPNAELSLRGVREGFVESIRINTSLVRRRIRSPNLWIEGLEIGSLSQTEIAVAYIKGLVGEGLLGELRSRLERIEIDSILGTGYLTEYITDNPWSIFPSVFSTERVDRVVGALLEGRVAIFVNGAPFVLIIPADFNLFLQAPDDYFEPFPLQSLIRLLRYASFIIAIFLPGVYVAVLTFHPELLPLSLLMRVQAAREGVPFPVTVETLFMEAVFEVLREAGVRLPMVVGPAISIVGALVLGDAAIRAGLVSPGVVIVVAFTAIASFTIPVVTFSLAARIFRFAVIILGATFGLLGVQFALLFLLIHLVSLRSFGHPYMAPYAPFIWDDMKDALIHLPWWKQIYRPKLLGRREPRRQPSGQKPRPPEK